MDNCSHVRLGSAPRHYCQGGSTDKPLNLISKERGANSHLKRIELLKRVVFIPDESPRKFEMPEIVILATCNRDLLQNELVGFSLVKELEIYHYRGDHDNILPQIFHQAPNLHTLSLIGFYELDRFA